MKRTRGRKVIVTCAVTGSVHTPSMSEFLPVTPEQITEQAIEAAHAGASVLHLHARDPLDGSPTPSPEIFDQFVPRIAERTDAIPELCSLNMGSMNFAFHKAARGVTDWKHAWEKPYVEGSEDLIFRNTFSDIKKILAQLGDAHGARFEFECYDVGHLYNLAHLVEEGLVRAPLFLQCVLGITGGLNADPENLFLMRSTADRLFGREDYEFSVLGAGRHQMSLVTMGAIMGGHVRVGLEDSLYLSRGMLASSCAAQVLKIRRILEELSLEIASPNEAREILQTKGADKVAFHG
jgi:uncharacterized protein (DUF849 family)